MTPMNVGAVLQCFPAVFDIDSFKADCQKAFTAKDSAGTSYSTGATFFLKSSDSPCCQLESMAKQIFEYHRARLNFTTIDEENSGIEWWTQCIDSRDDIAWHWDRDYQLEEDCGIHKYPNLATVTYLTAEGGATVVLNCRGTSRKEEPLGNGTVDSYLISWPMIGKHLFFGGELLHAAPSNIEEGIEDDDSDGKDESEEKEEGGAASEEEDEGPLRVTFLANLWINHIPQHSIRYTDKTLHGAVTPSPLALAFDCPAAVLSVPCRGKSNIRAKSRFAFQDENRSFRIHLPLPAGKITSDERRLVQVLCGSGDGVGAVVEDLGLCSDDSDEEEDDAEEDEEEEEPVEENTRLPKKQRLA